MGVCVCFPVEGMDALLHNVLHGGAWWSVAQLHTYYIHV